ncbi:FecR family protein [Variovorax sp. GT1P44]|uniref:FecR family protein n=1 Tax=Variovorax sp. GT1P44 TaxID=3443742 RepID=UPI003F46C5CA
MNKRIAIALTGLIFSSTAALAQTAASGDVSGEQRAGTMKSVRGDVRLLSSDGAARPAAPGDRVSPIDRIVTGTDSAASVVLRDGTSMVVGPSSRLDVKQFYFDSTTQEGGMLVSLLKGSLRMITGLIGKTHPDAVRVETRTAVIGIRGTDFIVEVDGQP